MARKCNCSGFCGPQRNLDNSEDSLSATEKTETRIETENKEETDPTVTRREFISLTSIGVAGAMLGGVTRDAAARNTLQQNSATLPEWKRRLFQPTLPTRYRSATHTDARMPLGGIGTGNFEIGADGQFTTWQLFNTLRDGNVPFCFGVRVGDTAKLLQTVGGPNGLPHIKSIEMTGEYPCATLHFTDADLPVHLEMTAFTPFAPLDTAFSSLPVACFLFKIHNPSGREQTVSLVGFLQNPVGYDALGAPLGFASAVSPPLAAPAVRHPNFGGNSNEILHEDSATLLTMRAQPAAEMTLDAPLHLYTNLPAGAFNTPYEGRPATLTVDGLDRIPASSSASPSVSPSISSSAFPFVWLEDAPADLSVSTLQTAVAAVRMGGTLVFSGRTMPLLQKYAELTGGKPLDTSTLRPDILFEDFEKGYENWTVEGAAFGAGPAHGALAGQQPVSGFVGKGFVNSYLGGDDPTGKLISKPFRIERSFIRFLIGGGSHSATQIRLLVDGKIVRAASGHDEERLQLAFWDVQMFAGKEAHIEIVDEQKGPWGHINIDEIQFCDLPGSAEVIGLLDQILPARFTDIRTLPVAERKDRTTEIEYQHLTLHSNARAERLSDGRTILVRPLGKGRVVLTSGPILEMDKVELLGARREAYQTLALLAGVNSKIQQTAGVPGRAPGFGTLTLGVVGKTTSHNIAFSDWQEGWKAFTAGNRLPSASSNATSPTPTGETHNAALAAHVVVPPGKTVEVPFFLTWHYPNKYSGMTWVGNHYSTVWPDALAVAKEAVKQFPVWRERTERFRAVFYDSTLPYWLLDCLTSQAATLRHIGVVFRIANGDVYGWEGSNGCCDPTCTHVWGYTMNMARLYPDLERDMRRIDYKRQQNPDGGVNNRTAVPSPPHPSGEHPFTDGHCSTVLKAYREALNYPDQSWLNEYWPGIKKSVEYLIARDAATSGGMPNGLLEDDQWNTYDEALHGVSGFIGTYYLAALRAGEAMATRMGDQPFARRCLGIFQEGQKNLIARCWNGEYLQQNLPGYERMNGEVGPGCMADQVIGQWWAHQLGLGYLLPPEVIKTALKSVFKYNWMPDLTGWKHNPRAFAGAGDKGLIICTWPKGGRPPNVMLYSDEVWTGIEYQVASHMLYEGMLEEGFAITRGARDRYDGIPRAPIPRSPWNEIECGGHYARAGSSWALLLALSGWHCDGMSGELAFRPLLTPERFKSFFSGPEGWGSLSQTRQGNSQHSEITLMEGKLVVTSLNLDTTATPKQVSVRVGGKAVAATLKPADKIQNGIQNGVPKGIQGGCTVTLSKPAAIKAGQSLSVTLTFV